MASLPSSLALATIADSSAIIAADHRNNYSAVQTAVNALITALGSGTAGQTLVSDGASAFHFAASAGITTHRKATAKTVNTSAAETDLLNGELTVGANELGANGVLELSIVADHLYNVAFGSTVRYRLKLGATTLWDSGALSGDAQSATRAAVHFSATIQNTATNAQVSQGLFAGGNIRPIAPAVGVVTSGTSAVIGNPYGWVGVAGTEDTTASKLLQFTVQHSDAGATHESKLYAALVKIT